MTRAGNAVVGTDERVGPGVPDEGDEFDVVLGPEAEHELRVHERPAHVERLAIAGQPRVHGGGGVAHAHEADARRARREQVRGDPEPRAAIVDPHHIVRLVSAVRLDRPVQQHHGDARIVERSRDAAVDRILGWRVLQRREERARDPARDLLLAHIPRGRFDSLLAGHRSPEHRMATHRGRAAEGPAHLAEDRRAIDVGRQQAEGERGRVAGPRLGARTYVPEPGRRSTRPSR